MFTILSKLHVGIIVICNFSAILSGKPTPYLVTLFGNDSHGDFWRILL